MGAKKWSKEEIEYLSTAWGIYSRKSIARNLGRSEKACSCKANAIGLGSFADNVPGLTTTEIAQIVGKKPHYIINNWIIKRKIPTRKRGMYRVVLEEDLKEFMKNNQQIWSAAKCDYWYFHTESWFLEKLERERNGKSDARHKDWTIEEINKMLRLRKKGLTERQIASELGRSYSSVDGKLYRMRQVKKVMKGM